MLAQEGDGAEDSDNRCGDGHANQVIGAGGGIGLLGRFLLFGRTDDDDGAGVIGGGRDDLARLGIIANSASITIVFVRYSAGLESAVTMRTVLVMASFPCSSIDKVVMVTIIIVSTVAEPVVHARARLIYSPASPFMGRFAAYSIAAFIGALMPVVLCIRDPFCAKMMLLGLASIPTNGTGTITKTMRSLIRDTLGRIWAVGVGALLPVVGGIGFPSRLVIGVLVGRAAAGFGGLCGDAEGCIALILRSRSIVIDGPSCFISGGVGGVTSANCKCVRSFIVTRVFSIGAKSERTCLFSISDSDIRTYINFVSSINRCCSILNSYNLYRQATKRHPVSTRSDE